LEYKGHLSVRTFFRIRNIFLYALIASGCASTSPKKNDTGKLDPKLGEEVIFIPLLVSDGSVRLETTVFYPKGEGMHPLIVINHGANGKLPSYHDQERFRPTELAKYFLARGYLVVAPMREGFSQSTGTCHFHCDHAHYALTYSRDIEGVIKYFVANGEADPANVLVAGQSNGGMVTLGYAANAPAAKAIINISGGVNTERGNCAWQAGMISAASELGAKTVIPSLWLYAKDDDIFPPSVSQPFFDAYKAGGAKTTMIMFGEGGHGFALHGGSQRVWGATVSEFLEYSGLPFEVQK
jgi:dienelactone hydrolase